MIGKTISNMTPELILNRVDAGYGEAGDTAPIVFVAAYNPNLTINVKLNTGITAGVVYVYAAIKNDDPTVTNWPVVLVFDLADTDAHGDSPAAPKWLPQQFIPGRYVYLYARLVSVTGGAGKYVEVYAMQ